MKLILDKLPEHATGEFWYDLNNGYINIGDITSDDHTAFVIANAKEVISSIEVYLANNERIE